MSSWSTLPQDEVSARFRSIGQRIRAGELDLGRQHYALALGQGVLQAIHCGYRRISAVELGVAYGWGLLDICKAAAFYRETCEIEIEVWGIDNAIGLPPITDHRDHPEIWHPGQFAMGDTTPLREKLPDFARLLIGDVGEVLDQFRHDSFGARLGFVAIDLDYYSSTVRAMPIFTMPAEHYLPAVPVYVDDVEVLITYNSWCGEAAAIREFNAAQAFRKIERNIHFGIHNFHVCHVLDHPIRTGKVKPALPFEIRAF